MPGITNPTLEDYAQRFRKLHTGRSQGAAKPHKPCLLLAVIELAAAGHLHDNRIPYGPLLVEAFQRYLGAVNPEANPATAFYPVWHLENDKFWHLHPKPDRDAAWARRELRHRSAKFLYDNLDYASLDPALHRLLLDAQARAQLRDTLIDAWVPLERRAAIREALRCAEQEQDYMHPAGTRPAAPEHIRDPAFRRAVLIAYDYRCAATGWRPLMPDGTALIEAAHIVPFSDSRDDRVGNGMALTPTFHGAMDRHLIAPGPDSTWHVSSMLDERISDHQKLLKLRGADIILPAKPKDRPSRSALEQRLEMLRLADRNRRAD